MTMSALKLIFRTALVVLLGVLVPVMAAGDQPSKNILNLAHEYDVNFHVAFGIVGFTTVLIAASLFGLSLAFWNMDPGRDSIIYRMTSQRMKKDN